METINKNRNDVYIKFYEATSEVKAFYETFVKRQNPPQAQGWFYGGAFEGSPEQYFAPYNKNNIIYYEGAVRAKYCFQLMEDSEIT